MVIMCLQIKRGNLQASPKQGFSQKMGKTFFFLLLPINIQEIVLLKIELGNDIKKNHPQKAAGISLQVTIYR